MKTIKCLILVLLLGFSWEGIAAKQQSRVKILSLSVGIFHDEPVPKLSAVFRKYKKYNKKGSYSKLIRVRYRPTDNTLRFDPIKRGEGTVIITHPKTNKVLYEYSFRVRETKLHQIVHDIKSLLSDIDGITVSVIGDGVAVDGKVLLPEDIARIHEVVQNFKGVTSLVTLSPVGHKRMGQYIERAINNEEISVSSVNGIFILTGWAKNKEERARAVAVAEAYLPDTVARPANSPITSREKTPIKNLIRIRSTKKKQKKKMVQVVVHFVELKNTYTRSFRFQWTPDIGDGSSLNFSTGGQTPSGLLTTFTGTIRNLLPKLNWAKQHGYARVLRSASFIVEEGKTGRIGSGSQVPYQNVGRDGIPVTQFQQTGLKVAVTPTLSGDKSNEEISLSTNFTLNTPVDGSGGALTSRDVNTTLRVRSGQSAAVAGLISNDVNVGYNRLPRNASTNPILSLYSSRDFQKSQSQFVVFITPILKSSASAGTEKIKRKFRIR